MTLSAFSRTGGEDLFSPAVFLEDQAVGLAEVFVGIPDAALRAVHGQQRAVGGPQGDIAFLHDRAAVQGIAVGGFEHRFGHVVAEDFLDHGGGYRRRGACRRGSRDEHFGGQRVVEDDGALRPGEGLVVAHVFQPAVKSEAHGLIDVGPGIARVHAVRLLAEDSHKHRHGVLLGDAALRIEGRARGAADVAGGVRPRDRAVVIRFVEVGEAGGVLAPRVVPSQHQPEEQRGHLFAAHVLVGGEFRFARALDDADVGEHGDRGGSLVVRLYVFIGSRSRSDGGTRDHQRRERSG